MKLEEQKIFRPKQEQHVVKQILTGLVVAGSIFTGAQLSASLWQHPVAVLMSGEILRD